MAAYRSLRMKALDIGLHLAREHVHEIGQNNRGPWVDRIITYAGGELGEPWCVDYVIWCYGHAGSRWIRPGYPRAVADMASAKVKPTRRPRAGDLVRYSFDHTGMLIGFRRRLAGRMVRCPQALATHLLAVEGNTPAGGALESDSAYGGDGVHIKSRPLALVDDFLTAES